MKKQYLIDWLCWVAYASFFCLPIWGNLLNKPNHYFYQDFPRAQFGLGILLVFGLATIACVAWRVIGGIKGGNYLKFGFLAVLSLVPINFLRRMFINTLNIPPLVFFGVSLALLVAIAIASIQEKNRKKIVGCLRFIVLLTGFALLPQAVYFFVVGDTPANTQDSAEQVPSATSTIKQRVVLVLFDELDQAFLYEHPRPEGYSYPQLDKLRSESFYAPKNYPASDATLRSIPAMTVGHFISSVFPTRSDELILSLEDGRKVNWKEFPNIFSDLKNRGLLSGVAGPAHPYCRIFRDTLGKCFHELKPVKSGIAGIAEQFRLLADAFPLLASRLNVMQVERSDLVDIHHRLEAHAKELIHSDELSFIFLHFLAPHPPSIFNGKSKTFNVEGPPSSYFDSLALVDETLKKLTKWIHSTNGDRETTLILTSDHWLRFWEDRVGISPEDFEFYQESLKGVPDHRVPFLVNLPKLTAGLTYPETMNNVAVRDLVLRLFEKEPFESYKDLAEWMEKSSPSVESPFTKEISY